MHNGFGYIYESVGLRADASRQAVPQKDANMSIEQFIDNEVKSNDVVLFMKGTPQFPQCGFSGQVVQILDHVGVGYKGLNVLQSAELRDGIKTYSNWPTIPQLYVKGEFVAGLEHLADNVAAADELTLDVELRNGRPVGIGLDAVAQFGGFKDIQSLVADPDVIEDLHHLSGKTALRKLRRALHEQHDVVRLHFLVDKLLDAHIHVLLPFAA